MPISGTGKIISWMVFPLFWGIAFLLMICYQNAGVLRGFILLGAMIIVALLMRRYRDQQTASGTGRLSPVVSPMMLLVVLAVFAAAQIACLIVSLGIQHSMDILVTTIEAGRLMVEGANPYATPIDSAAAATLGSLYAGFKYLPVMAAAYAPFGLPFGARGVLLANLLLQATTTGLVGALAAGEDHRRDAGLVAAAIYLSLPIVAIEAFVAGVTDPLPVVLLLAALLLATRHPLLSGLLAGLSVSSKLLPGLAALPACFPGRQGSRWPFVIGLMLGLVPSLVYFVIDPLPFFANIVAFNLVRPIDVTSWLPGDTPWLAHGAQLVFAGGWLAASTAAWRTSLGLEYRCGLAALLVMGSILAGGINRENYPLWWLPLMSVVVARGSLGAAGPRQIAERLPSPI